MENIKENRMGTEPILKLLIKMSIPAMLSMLVGALYNIVDSIFVAQISEEALTAISLAFPVQVLLIAISIGTGIGVNSLIARKLGEKKTVEANNAAEHGIILGIISFIPFLIFGLFFTKQFFELFTTNQEIINLSVQYTRCVSIFSFSVIIQSIIEKMLQATGRMIYPMIFQLIGAVANLILDPILIFGLFGAPQLGILGAAIATVIAQLLSMIYSIYILIKKDHEIKISFRHFKFNLKIVKDIYSVGFPSIIMQSISAFMVVILNTILIAFSDVAVSVLGIYFKLQTFVFLPVFGLTSGLMPIIGYNFGAENKKRIISATKLGCIIALIIMILGTVVFILFGRTLLIGFNASEEMINIGVVALRIISTGFVFAAIEIVLSTFFQATNHGMSSLLTSVFRQLLGIIPIAYFMARLGLNYVWMSFPISEIMSFILSIIIFFYIYKKQIKNL